MDIPARAERNVAIARDGPKELQEAHVSRAVCFRDARDGNLELSRELAHYHLGFRFAAPVGIIGRKRAGFVDHAPTGSAAIDTNGAPMDEPLHACLDGGLQKVSGAVHINLAEVHLRGLRFVLCGCQMNDGVLVRYYFLECRAVCEVCDIHLYTGFGEELAAPTLAIGIDGGCDSNLATRARRDLREPAADKSRASRNENFEHAVSRKVEAINFFAPEQMGSCQKKNSAQDVPQKPRAPKPYDF